MRLAWEWGKADEADSCIPKTPNFPKTGAGAFPPWQHSIHLNWLSKRQSLCSSVSVPCSFSYFIFSIFAGVLTPFSSCPTARDRGGGWPLWWWRASTFTSIPGCQGSQVFQTPKLPQLTFYPDSDTSDFSSLQALFQAKHNLEKVPTTRRAGQL